MEIELVVSKDYYLLSIDIYKTLSLSSEHRPIPAKEYLEKKYNEYVKLSEKSNLISKRLEDKLAPLPVSLPPTPLSKSSSELSIIIPTDNEPSV
jgi:hypothetical protein